MWLTTMNPETCRRSRWSPRTWPRWSSCSTCCWATTRQVVNAISPSTARSISTSWTCSKDGRPGRAASARDKPRARHLAAPHALQHNGPGSIKRKSWLKKKTNTLQEEAGQHRQRHRPAFGGHGAAHHGDARNQLHARRHEHQRLTRVPRDRRLETLAPQAALHHVQDGPAQGRAPEERQHRGSDDELNPHGDAPTARRWSASSPATRHCSRRSWSPRATLASTTGRPDCTPPRVTPRSSSPPSAPRSSRTSTGPG